MPHAFVRERTGFQNVFGYSLLGLTGGNTIYIYIYACREILLICVEAKAGIVFNIYTNKPLNNIPSLTAWKNLQFNGGYMTTLIMTLHREPYELDE
jgi:hypothetical protein